MRGDDALRARADVRHVEAPAEALHADPVRCAARELHRRVDGDAQGEALGAGGDAELALRERGGAVPGVGAAGVCVAYVLAVYFSAMAITGLTGHWWPDRIAWPGLELAGGVVIVIALSLLGSIVLSSTANGIAVFMLFGGGLVAGLLASIGHALNSHAIKHASTIAAWALPFEALYQDALRMITENTSGLTGFLLQLGPFGGAYVHGWPIRLWAVLYLVAVGALALWAFSRRNL